MSWALLRKLWFGFAAAAGSYRIVPQCTRSCSSRALAAPGINFTYCNLAALYIHVELIYLHLNLPRVI
ncbi:hypothetical protein BS78_08G057800 [Paspalum vaginatum]|nr:hypothetical protein BS78_08G057800 [Paspalum vaginatum]